MAIETLKIIASILGILFIPFLIIWSINSYLKSIEREQQKMLEEFRRRKEVELKNEMSKPINPSDPNSELRLQDK